MKVLLLGSVVYLLLVTFLARKKLHELHPRRFFLDTWAELDKQAREARAERAYTVALPDGTLETHYRHDWKPLFAYVSLAFILTMQEYFGDRGTFHRLRDRGLVFDFGPRVDGAPAHTLVLHGPFAWLGDERWGDLYALGWWALTRAGGYTLLPILMVLLWRERLRDYGFSFKGFSEHAWIYALFFGIVQILVVLVARTPDFANYYPFYAHASRSWQDFFLWECMYAVQFLALEFFFRGFLLFSSARSLGSGVILAMVVPYCMIHFGKPVLETLGAIIAGTVLGTLALKTRSIWSGFLIHVTVALSMDMAALLQRTGLPGGIRLPPSWGF